MRKYKKSLIVLVVFCYILSIQAFAESNNVSFDKISREVNIRGNMENGAGYPVTMSIKHTNDTEAVYWNECIADENGGFEFTCQMSNTFKSGWYEVLVGAAGVEAESYRFLFVNDRDEREYGSQFSDITDVNILKERIAGIGQNMGIETGDKSDFSLLTGEGRDKVLLSMCGRIFDTASAVKEYFDTAVMVQTFNQSAAEKADALLGKYQKKLGIDIGEASLYSYAGTYKNIIYSKITGKDFDITSPGQLFNAYDRAACLAAINNLSASNRDKFAEFIEYANSKGYCNISLEKFLSENMGDLTRLKIINEFISLKNEMVLEDFNEIGSVYEKAQKKALEKKDNGVGGGTPSGSGDYIAASLPEKAPEIEIITFNDLDEAEWARDSILKLAQKGIINGVGGGAFAPNQPLTREQLVKLLTQALGIERKDTAVAFEDVIKGEWYYEYVAAAYENGIVKGISPGLFGTGEAVTREQLCTMLYRAIEALGVEYEFVREDNAFLDKEEISEYAREAVNYLYRVGLIDGMGNNMFSPKLLTTRAQCAKIICNLIERSGSK